MDKGSNSAKHRWVALPVCALAVVMVAWVSVITFDAADWPSPDQYPHNAPTLNRCGMVGAVMSYYLRYWLGVTAYPLLALITCALLMKLYFGKISSRGERFLGGLLLLTCVSASAQLILADKPCDLTVGHGGVVGLLLANVLSNHLDHVGTIIVLTTSLIVGLLFVTEGWILRLPSLMRWLIQRGVQILMGVRVAFRTLVTPLRPAIVGASRVSSKESAALLGVQRTKQVEE